MHLMTPAHAAASMHARTLQMQQSHAKQRSNAHKCRMQAHSSVIVDWQKRHKPRCMLSHCYQQHAANAAAAASCTACSTQPNASNLEQGRCRGKGHRDMHMAWRKHAKNKPKTLSQSALMSVYTAGTEVVRCHHLQTWLCWSSMFGSPGSATVCSARSAPLPATRTCHTQRKVQHSTRTAPAGQVCTESKPHHSNKAGGQSRHACWLT